MGWGEPEVGTLGKGWGQKGQRGWGRCGKAGAGRRGSPLFCLTLANATARAEARFSVHTARLHILSRTGGEWALLMAEDMHTAS